MLEGKSIVLGVTGSIAAYKAVEIASQLTQLGAKVDVLITKDAEQFVTPLTFRAVTGRPVISDMFESTLNNGITHVSLAENADAVVIAPITANTIAKLAKVLKCSQRTIHRNMGEELKREKELLNRQNEN